jgi:hypothetical protein
MRKKSTPTRKPTREARARATRDKRSRTSTEEPLAPKNLNVYGVYKNIERVQTIVESLRNAGFRDVDVSEFTSDESGQTNAFVDENALKLTSLAANVVGCIAGLILSPLAIVAGGSVLQSDMQFDAERVRGAVVKVRCTGLERLQSLTDILEKSGARDIAASVNVGDELRISERLKLLSRDEDLQRRQYRDADGQLHHHTHSFLQQHVSEESTA